MYTHPEEHDFTWEGFGLGEDNRPHEAVFSYIYQYDDKELYFSHSIWGRNHVRIQIVEAGIKLTDIYWGEALESITFMGENEEKFIRVVLKDEEKEMKVFYHPKPRIIFSLLEK
ncbi:MAG: hypothetical protein NE327_03010 [Lentisphaeraceae bacterium]|nr:hypothetical protein [Lentisphaeraceae bacterium]